MDTPSLDQLSATLRRELPALAKQYGITSLRLFGSYARRQQRPDSDLDLLVSFQENPGLLRFIELENRLSDLLGVKVDLVLGDSLKPAIAERIRQDAVAL